MCVVLLFDLCASFYVLCFVHSWPFSMLITCILGGFLLVLVHNHLSIRLKSPYLFFIFHFSFSSFNYYPSHSNHIYGSLGFAIGQHLHILTMTPTSMLMFLFAAVCFSGHFVISVLFTPTFLLCMGSPFFPSTYLPATLFFHHIVRFTPFLPIGTWTPTYNIHSMGAVHFLFWAREMAFWKPLLSSAIYISYSGTSHW